MASPATPLFGSATPLLRLFDEAQTRAFYIGFLGFTLDWEHRFGDNFPLYQQVSLGGCVLHLTGHFGDCSPGGAVRIPVADVATLQALQQRLLAADYRHAKPGLEDTPWGTRELRLTDPAGNRLVFHADLPAPNHQEERL
ncbi:MAG: VOC family protein [Ottowia sp.]|nr:VOC family protein [Ottowia sp.]